MVLCKEGVGESPATRDSQSHRKTESSEGAPCCPRRGSTKWPPVDREKDARRGEKKSRDVKIWIQSIGHVRGGPNHYERS